MSLSDHPVTKSDDFILKLVKEHGRFNCLDGVIHSSTVGKKRMFVFYCNKNLDGVICNVCWAVDDYKCDFNIDNDHL